MASGEAAASAFGVDQSPPVEGPGASLSFVLQKKLVFCMKLETEIVVFGEVKAGV